MNEVIGVIFFLGGSHEIKEECKKEHLWYMGMSIHGHKVTGDGYMNGGEPVESQILTSVTVEADASAEYIYQRKY